MPTLHDTPEGTTHSHGGGNPAHNPWWKQFCVHKSVVYSEMVVPEGSMLEELLAEAELRTLARPMGVSEWNQHGKKFGYWEYFEKLHLEAITLDEYKKRRALNRALDGKVVIDLETAKLANEAMGWITERDPNEEEAMKFEKAQKELIQAIRAASKPCQETPVMMRKLKPDETTMYKGKKYEVGAQGEWDNGHDFQIMVPVKKSKVTSSPPKPRT
jgi:hypothetical protein